MNDEHDTRHIRPIAICVFRDGDRILVGDGYDPTKREVFYRPLGGGIRFGEASQVALRREIYEELGAEIENPRLLGVIENLFTFDGEPGHEVVFVYDAELKDPSLYQCDQLDGRESNDQPFRVRWIDIGSHGPNEPPVYPAGLIDLLENSQM
jgi:8-oxo-dGTP pyrophosphatase MutT (NUDIX family)